MSKNIALLAVIIFVTFADGAALAECLGNGPAESDFPDSLVTATDSPGIHSAWYDDATDRYAHGVLGDAIEPSTLAVRDENGCTYLVILDEAHVFEDLAPRLADIDGFGGTEVVTVRSHRAYGAQVAIYQLADNQLKLLAETPYIGTSNRWLAPVGVADLNNDGDMDIAYVDRPHLAKMLRVWSFRDGELQQVASESGYSNHRIGEAFISGGLNSCSQKITMITADADWARIMETSLEDGQLVSKDIGAFQGKESLDNALLCK